MSIIISKTTGVPSVNHVKDAFKNPIYKNFYMMHYRIHNIKQLKVFSKYQEKNIKISDSWIDFEVFIEDMLPTYKEGYVLDRIDNDGDYCKENCQWLTIGANVSKDVSIPVFQYTLKGIFIKEFPSRIAAIEEIGGSATACSRATIKLVPYGGYRWSDLYCPEGLPEELQNKIISSNVPVRQIDKDTLEVIKIWDKSLHAADALNIPTFTLTQCLNGKLYHAGNFKWEYTINVNTGEIPEIRNDIHKSYVKINQYELVKHIEVVDKFISIAEAVVAIKGKPGMLKEALKKGNTYKGYTWRYDSLALIEQCAVTTSHKLLREWPNSADAGRAVGVARGNITAVCKGKKKSAGGFAWRYA